MIVHILENIKDRKPSNASEALFGFQNFHTTGSANDLLVLELEKELIARRFVNVIEPGGTNKTQNGYAYFVISVEGLQWLRSQSQGLAKANDILIHALSTSKDDSSFLDEGMALVGLVGYILDRQEVDSVPLEWIKVTLGSKEDNLYTTTRDKERISKRNPRDMGVLGYVYNSEKFQTVQLRRLFHRHTLDHLYISNFVSFSDEGNYTNESGENPMFLHRSKVNNSRPLYLYSNAPQKFQALQLEENKLYSTENDYDFSREDRIKELQRIIEEKGLDPEDFSIPLMDPDAITVFLLDGPQNFHINLQEDRKFFTVRINPGRPDGEDIFNDVDSWPYVLDYFTAWLDSVGGESQTESTVRSLDEAKGVRFMEGATRYSFRNEKVKAALNVETQAGIFFEMLDRFPKTESGLLLGIFGKWGRGKTYFWERLKTIFNQRAREAVKRAAKKEPVKDRDDPFTVFECVEFHAWKYQDTAASWAYLYEVFVKKFIERPRRLLFTQYRIQFKWFNRFVNLLRLNLTRVGWFPFSYGLLALTYGLVWYFFLDLDFKLRFFSWIFTAIGVGTLISSLFYYYFYSGTAKNLIKQFFSEPSYQDMLGIQAEIQKELRALFGVWICEKEITKKRIVLFIDDVDRCSEEHIIRVIDALKVMMDDPFISQRVIVIAAIDETVLKRAIKLKYHKMVTRDLSISEEQKKDFLEQLCREYMDKLFLIGFKLGVLSENDKIEIVKSIAEERTFFRNEKRKEEKFEKAKTGAEIAPEQTAGNDRQTVTPTPTTTGSVKTPNKSPSVSDIEKYITMMPNEEFEIMDYELEYILSAVKKLSNATPRSIRIFYYRYLLAKHFKEIIIQRDSALYNEWLTYQQKEILCYLIVEYSSEKKQQDLLDELTWAALNSPSQTSKILLGKSFMLSANLYHSLLKVVEIVVPY